MTDTEKQAIIDAVLSSLRTNSRTIEQLTPVTQLSSADYFEVNGGRKIAYTVLANLISTMSAADQSNLQTAIDKKELQSVSITTTQSSATLTIKSVGKTISCSVPVATSSQSGIITAADKVKLDSAYNNASSALTQANAAKTTADNAYNGVYSLNLQLNNLAPIVNGVNIFPFNKMCYHPQEANDLPNGSIVFGADNHYFYLKSEGSWVIHPTYNTTEDSYTVPKSDRIYRCGSKLYACKKASGQDYYYPVEFVVGSDEFDNIMMTVYGIAIYPFDGISAEFDDEFADNILEGQIFYVEEDKTFYSMSNGTIGLHSAYLGLNNKPRTDRLFRLDNQLYRWDGTEFKLLGEDPETVAKVNRALDQIDGIGIVPISGFMPSMPGAQMPQRGIYFRQTVNGPIFVIASLLNGFTSKDYLDDDNLPRTDRIYRNGTDLYKFDGKTLVKIGGSSATGNCYNVTNEKPLESGEFYDLESAINATFNAGVSAAGMQITFAIASGSWKTYQYVGPNITETNFKNQENWIDSAGMSAGSESVLNVNALCGDNEERSLGQAIQAILDKETASGLTYRKPGLVFTYLAHISGNGENVWKTYQFIGENIGNFKGADAYSSLFKEFGGGSSTEISTSDEPEADGKDAFSTGGAYDKIPTNFSIDDSEEGVVKLQLVNANNKPVGDQKSFAVGTGGGTAAALLEITPQSSQMSCAAGGTVLFNCAITLRVGSEYESGIVETVELRDRSTLEVVETFKVNKQTSMDKETFDFSFDLSKYFKTAGSRNFTLYAYDDAGRVGTRNVRVTAVDLTIASSQSSIGYTSAGTLIEDGDTKILSLYEFPNNASVNGILAITEILLDGEWVEIGRGNVNTSWAQSVSINPQNCGGKRLTHGAYLLRIHGEDADAGVVGNYLYTTIMVVNPTNSTPILAIRWLAESLSPKVKQFESVSVDYAAYNPNSQNMDVEIVETIAGESKVIRTANISRNQTMTQTIRVENINTDGSVTLGISFKSGSVVTPKAEWQVKGSVIDITETTSQLRVNMDFSTRSNSENDKTMTSLGHSLTLEGVNWSTNGFIKDSFGTDSYDPLHPDTSPGITALRIAEGVKGTLDYAPFATGDISTIGSALRFRLRTRNVADEEAHLIECLENGVGFWVSGKKVIVTTDGGVQSSNTITADLEEDKISDIQIVWLPNQQSTVAGTGEIQLHLDGELIGATSYVGSLSPFSKQISFDGAHADLYLYGIQAWETYFRYREAFNNYLLKLADSNEMLTEYDFNSVMASQQAEGKPAMERPQAAQLLERGIVTVTICKSSTTDNSAKNFPSYLEGLNGDKKTAVTCDVYVRFPDRPWADFVVRGIPVTNQGTTSSFLPIKNKKGKNKKGIVMELLHSRDEFSGAELALYDKAAALANKFKFQIKETSMPTSVWCVKVDFQESSGANNGAFCQQFNELQRALGSEYMTPAQNAYTGEYELNTSIDSVPCALFMTDPNSDDPTSPANAYFHAKGNLNMDKSDATVFGFEAVPGYNADCLNYGEFYELIAAEGQTLAQFLATQDKEAWQFVKSTEENVKEDGSKEIIYHYWDVVVLSEFCGPGHRIFRRENNDSAWQETTGTMTYTAGKWVVSGDYVNPVECIELKKYNALCWFQGVNSVDDLKKKNETTGNPEWLDYFESRYPDNDELNQAYEDGRKIPYQLYRWLEWCQKCNHNLTASDGDITIDGVTVSGTTENRLHKFERELHTLANVKSCCCYNGAIDGHAAVDQMSKNAMLAWYLCTDGVVRLYMNHLYDGDCIDGSDNDCGKSISPYLDPANDTEGKYQGHDSVLFTGIRNASKIWLKDYTGESDVNDSTKTTDMATIWGVMREATNGSGLKIFSPEGIEKYWIQDRLSKWPKLVSSYDGSRKYIETATSTTNYMYALHGLDIQRLREFVKTRFRYRDGYYGCGSTLRDSWAKMRCTGTNISLTVTAALDGYFGIGTDQGEIYDGTYLKAGETATFYSGITNQGGGIVLYIYGADRIGKIDVTNAVPKNDQFDWSQMCMLTEIILGGNGWSPGTEDGILSILSLGQMPFLEKIDARNFPLTEINATYCPRLKELLTEGSKLKRLTLAETCPIDTLSLPATIEWLMLRDLPKLTYPGGLTLAGVANVTQFMIDNCPYIDSFSIFKQLATNGKLSLVGMHDVNITETKDYLLSIKNNGVTGMDSNGNPYSESNICSGLTGRWILKELVEDDMLASLQAYFPQLDLHNSQFSIIKVQDDEVDEENKMTNLDNNTGRDFNTPFVQSGHLLAIEKNTHAYKCTFNELLNRMEGEALDDLDFNFFADGTSIDLTDNAGEGYDIMWHLCHCWYKGINDFKNQVKYYVWSFCIDEPISTSSKCVRKSISQLLYQENSGIYVNNATVGVNADDVIATTANVNVYRMDVEGMKQVRWPGINMANLGCLFTDEEGKVIDKFKMSVSNSQFDFDGTKGDYIFTDVPAGAKWFFFTAYIVIDQSIECIAVDSMSIEAIEPDWVEHNAAMEENIECEGDSLIGIYPITMDALKRPRSISSTGPSQRGTGTSTNGAWEYDADGNPTSIPTGNLNYTMKDFENLAWMRGPGFQLIDYEQHKETAIVWWCCRGRINEQAVVGNGQHAGRLNQLDNIGMRDSEYNGNNFNSIMGLKAFIGCNNDWMTNFAVNVTTFLDYKKRKGAEFADFPINHVAHIYDPISNTERTLTLPDGSGDNVLRLIHGRRCDILPSRVDPGDRTKYVTDYCAGYWCTNSRSRVLLRSSYNANAYSGFAYAYANNACTNSNTYFGARLAFRGTFVIVKA